MRHGIILPVNVEPRFARAQAAFGTRGSQIAARVVRRVDQEKHPHLVPPSDPGPAAGLAAPVFFLALVTILCSGCLSTTRPVFSDLVSDPLTATNPPPVDPRATNYANAILQEGDSVSITFQFATNFNSFQKVMLDGTINLDLVGQLKAAGKTPLEIQAEITKLYQRLPQAKDDSATVRLLAGAASVYVSGAVNRPGKIPIEHPMTALEAIMEAGSFDPNRARLSRVTVVRIEDGRQHTYRLNLRGVLRGNEDSPFYLKPFDVVHVPTKTFNF